MYPYFRLTPVNEDVEYRGICECGRALRSTGSRGPVVQCTNCPRTVTLKAVGS